MKKSSLAAYYFMSLFPGSALAFYLYYDATHLPWIISYILASFTGATIYLPLNKIIFRENK